MRDKLAFVDVESFPDYFMISFRMRHGDEKKDVILEVDDWETGRVLFSNEDYWYITFNGINYDNIMVAFWLWLGADATDEKLYDMNQYLIEGRWDNIETQMFIDNNVEEFSYKAFGGRQERVSRSFKYNCEASKLLGGRNRKEIDLYMLGEKQGSLKNAATVLGVDSLMECPLDFGVPVGDQRQLVIDYCFKDIEITEKAYDYYEQNMVVRDEFFQRYKIRNAHNIGSAKLAEKYLLSMLEDQYLSEGDRFGYKAWVQNTKADLEENERKGERVTELLSAYPDLDFNDKGMSQLWSMLKKSFLTFRTTTSSDVDVWVDETVNFEEYRKDLQKPSPYFIDRKAIPKGALLFDDDRGNTYKFGIGGLHNDAPKNRWITNDEWIVWNVDVTSYYPSLIAANKFAPVNFQEFPQYIEQLLADRRRAKAEGNKIESDAKKLVLNSSFGKTKDRHSLLYEPKAHFSVTLCGQLLLLKLIEMVHQASSGAELINANTDGVCFYLPKKDLEAVRAVCKAWEVYSRVELEEDLFDCWYQSSCNNYCAKMDNGAIKSKGGDYKLKPSALKETFSKSPALKKALVYYVLEGTPIETTLASLPVSEFCMTMNFGKKTQLMIDGKVTPKKVLRYYYSKSGVKFHKYTPSTDRTSIVGKGRDLVMADVLDDIHKSDLDLETYALDVKEMILDNIVERKTKCLPKKIRENIGNAFTEWEKENATKI